MATEPLYGNPAVNAPVWSKYAVLFGAIGATIPTGPAAFVLNDPTAGTPVTGQWDPMGTLDPDNPFDSGVESLQASDHAGALPNGIYATSFKDQKEVLTFTMKETRLVTLGVLYDTSGITVASGNLSGTLKLRDPTKKFLIAFHRQNAAGLIERRISKNYAYIADAITRNQGNDETTYTVPVAIVPDSTTTPAGLYTYYLGT